MSRAIRNNNPMNLRISNSQWQGKVENGTDKEFEQFESWVLGLRANLKNMRTLFFRGKNTIRKLVSTWAPANENDTENYISFVSKRSGIAPDQLFNWEIESVWLIAEAMTKIESGKELTKQDFAEAWRML